MKRNNLFIYAAAFFIFSLASIYITYPLIFHLGDYATGYGDELVIAWIQNWVIHVLISGKILLLFNANIYYPFANTLAYSDLFFTGSLFSFLPILFVGQPIAAVNFTLIAVIALLGFSLFVLVLYLTKDIFASLLAGCLLIFSSATLSFYIHLQVLEIACIPFSLLYFLKFMNKKKTVYLCISLLFFILQTYNSFLPGYFIIFSYVIILLWYIVKDKGQTIKVLTLRNILFLLCAFLIILPIAIPYFKVSNEFHYVRDIRDSIHFALQPEDLFYPSHFTRLAGYLVRLPFNTVSQNNEFKPGYLGFVFTILVIFAYFYLLRNVKKKSNLFVNIFAVIGLVGLMLSFGPFLHLGRHTIHKPFPIPLPYFLFYYIIPGFQGFRNAARWEMLFVLANAIVVALVLHNVLAKLSLQKKMLIYILLFIGIIAEFNFPMHFVSVPQRNDFPKVYTWLGQHDPTAAMIELPIYNWNAPYVGQELFREYENTIYFQKTVNGYSGFSPPPWQELVTSMQRDFPSKETIARLKKISVKYVVIHKNEYDILAKDRYMIDKKKIDDGVTVIDSINKTTNLKLIKRFNNDYIYRL